MFFLFKYVTNGDSFLNRVHESWIEKCGRNIEHAGLHGDEWGNWRRKYQILLLCCLKFSFDRLSHQASAREWRVGLFRSKRCELYGRGIGRKEIYELTQEGSLCSLCAKKMQVGTKVACLNVFIGRLIFFFFFA